MPLSLRRSRTTSQSDQTKRAVSQPTLLSRLGSSAFGSSKTSLLTTSAYDTVRSRTPPTPIPSVSRATPMSGGRAKRHRRLHARWRLLARQLRTPEQRECLAGAECLWIIDPLLGRLESPDVSVEVESEAILSDRSRSVILEDDLEMVDARTLPARYITQPRFSTVPATRSPQPHSLFRHPALPESKSKASIPDLRESHGGVYRKVRGYQRLPGFLDTIQEDTRDPQVSETSLGPPFPPHTPRPRSPTPHRMLNRGLSLSSDWNAVPPLRPR